jgi:hypothetical protein
MCTIFWCQGDYILWMTSRYFFRSFTNVRSVFCLTFQWYDANTRCMIQDVVTPHCGDKRMARRCTRRSLPNYFDMMSYHRNVRQNTYLYINKNVVNLYIKELLMRKLLRTTKENWHMYMHKFCSIWFKYFREKEFTPLWFLLCQKLQ